MIDRLVPLPALPHTAGALARTLGTIDPAIARLLDGALEGREISPAEGAALFRVQGAALIALMLTADELRRRTVGDLVTYVTVRNVNFTNVCTVGCHFCAFSRLPQAPDADCLSPEEAAAKAAEAGLAGCTEICARGGLNPALDARYSLDLVAAIKQRAPAIH